MMDRWDDHIRRAAHIGRLHNNYGGNLYLMYIGYNSGPAVANNLWDRVSKDPAVDLDTIELHLPDAMRPYYGDGSRARANSLVNTHLPKIQRAYDRYHLRASAPDQIATNITPQSSTR